MKEWFGLPNQAVALIVFITFLLSRWKKNKSYFSIKLPYEKLQTVAFNVLFYMMYRIKKPVVLKVSVCIWGEVTNDIMGVLMSCKLMPTQL